MGAFKETKVAPNAPAALKALAWIDDRFPLSTLWNDQWGKYYAPKNFNFWYIFGSLALLVLAFGIFPNLLLDKIGPGVSQLLQHVLTQGPAQLPQGRKRGQPA